MEEEKKIDELTNDFVEADKVIDPIAETQKEEPKDLNKTMVGDLNKTMVNESIFKETAEEPLMATKVIPKVEGETKEEAKPEITEEQRKKYARKGNIVFVILMLLLIGLGVATYFYFFHK